jgi:hypothetical protein
MFQIKKGIIASSGSSFINPKSIPNLWAWWESDAGVTLAGSNVTGWADQSGNGNDLVVSSGRFAAILTENVINSYPALLSNTSGGNYTRYETLSNFPNCNLSGLTVFIVGRSGSSNDSSGSFISYAGIGNDGDAPRIYRLGGNPHFLIGVYNDDSGSGASISGVASNTFHSIRLVDSVGANELTLNNSQSISENKTPLNTYQAYPLFVFGGGSSQSNKGIAQIIIYTRNLSESEIENVETFLRNKYNHY